MPNNNLILRTLISPWITPTPDTTKSSVLKHIDVDNNFIYLRGELIYSATTVGNLVTLKKINGNDLSFNVGSGGGSGYWTSGSTGFYSIKTINDSGLDATGNYSVASGFNTLSIGNVSFTHSTNSIASSDYTSILGGQNNEITASSNNSSIVGGTGNTIGGSINGHILGGYDNSVSKNSDLSVIIAGSGNTIDNGSQYNTIINGFNNTIYASGHVYSSIIGGQNNEIGSLQSIGSGILGGDSNLIQDSDNSMLIGGSGNTITHDRSVILGGQGITSSADDTVYVPNLEVRGQAYTPIYDNLTGGTTFVPDWDNSNVQILTLSGNTNVSGGTSTMEGGSTYTMLVKQSNGGSHTITYDSTYKWEEGNPPTLSTADGSVDIITFICDGTNLYGLIAQNFQ